MTKKSGFILFVLVFLTIGVVWFGQDYQKKQKLALLEMNGSSQINKDDSSSNKEENESSKTETFEKNRDKKSVLDYISTVPTEDRKKSVSFYGDFSESENWLTSVEKNINEQANNQVEFTYVALPDFDSYQLLEENSVSTLKEKTPDVVFFQVPIYGDQVRDISLVDSTDYIMQNYDAIKKALPDALVVFVTPNPSSSRKEDYNSRTLIYTSYLDEVLEMVKENNLPLFDLHEAFNGELESANLALESTLAEDGKTLNDKGNEIYSSLFNKELMGPVDTTTGK